MVALGRDNRSVHATDFTVQKDNIHFRWHVPRTELTEITSLRRGRAMGIRSGKVFKTRSVLPLPHDLLGQLGAGHLNVTRFDP